MKVIFDFETDDPDLKKRGPGWVFGTGRILGMGYKITDNEGEGEVHYTVDENEMVFILNAADTWVAHNLTYELGWAKYRLGIEFKNKVVRDTLVGAYLQDNRRQSFSLDALAKEIGEDKDQARMGRFVIESGLKKFSKLKSDPDGLRRATTWAMENLGTIAIENPALVEEYCKSDVEITSKWDKKLLDLGICHLYETFSEAQKVMVEMQKKGVRVDELKMAEVSDILTEKIQEREEAIDELTDFSGFVDFNYRSSDQVGKLLETEGWTVPRTDKGNYNVDKKFLESCDHPIAKLIIECKKYRKARDDFCDNLGKFMVGDRIHGQMLLFGARETGRFSHRLPNLAQIPRRDEEVGPLIRSIFVANDNEQWYSLDFSSQEPRLLLHFALKCSANKVKYRMKQWDSNTFGNKYIEFVDEGLQDVKEAYRKDPTISFHKYNADMIKKICGLDIGKDAAKTIGLGKTYGMGIQKLTLSLGVGQKEGKEIIDAFYTAFPYIRHIENYCKYIMATRGRIKLISGRVLRDDGMPHKALNKKIQGSAADQMILTLIELYHKGIVPSVVVHDEINISGTEEESLTIKQIMENSLDLEIPMYAEIGSGPNWAEAK